MPDALMFDFDGVVVDSEPIHLACFREVLARRKIPLTTEEYYGKYIGFHDHDCFAAAMRAHAHPVDQREVLAMTAEKTRMVQKALAESTRPLPGALELMRAARAGGAGVAICTGAWRKEVTIAIAVLGAAELVDVIVCCDDVRRHKPDPEGYLLTMRRLGQTLGRCVHPERCWVIEDAPAGIEAGRKAGCRVLAVTTSYDARALSAADTIVHSLAEVSLSQLADAQP